MIATLVIGLREGLEAALIVGIIAAFLRKNGHSLLPMWIGVTLAVILSIAVGVALSLVEQALPQAAQEGLESIIGAVAIVFVTGMILWMNTHARGMKSELEAEAAAALGKGSAYSLAIMAFLAVLKEGFETSVFLLATFSAAQSAAPAAVGAVIGVLIAVAIGWGIYVGGVRLNLARFFRVTGAFLILVAAGLVITMLRTAHEAGWLNAGQQPTVDLSWLVQRGTIQSALITGVLGIPADPRRIEVMGWLAYLIPVSLYVYWPAAHRPRERGAARVRFGMAGALAAAALLLALVYPVPHSPVPATVTLVAPPATSQQEVGTAHLAPAAGDATELQVTLADGGTETLLLAEGTVSHELYSGVSADAWVISRAGSPADTVATVTLDELATLAGGRIPIGIDRQRQPGPFTLEQSTATTDTIWIARNILLDATQTTKTIARLSGGGLDTPRTISLKGGDDGNWAVPTDDTTRAIAAVHDLAASEAEYTLWARQIPLLLVIAALLFALAGHRTLQRQRAPVLHTGAGTRPAIQSV